MQKIEVATIMLDSLKREFSAAATDDRKSPEETAFALQIERVADIIASSDEAEKPQAVARLRTLKKRFDAIVKETKAEPFSFDTAEKGIAYSLRSERVTEILKLI